MDKQFDDLSKSQVEGVYGVSPKPTIGATTSTG